MMTRAVVVTGAGIALLAVVAALSPPAAMAVDLRGYVQANYTRSEPKEGGRTERDAEQIRAYLRDRLFVKNEWTLEFGLDRYREVGGVSIERPRYATTFRGNGYQASLSFVPVRSPDVRGGTQQDEWRGSLSMPGGRWPQLSFTYFRRNDRQDERNYGESWLGSLGLQRDWVSARANLQGQRQNAATRVAATKAILSQAEISLTPDIGRSIRGAVNYGLSTGLREGALPKTTTIDHFGAVNIGADLRRWASWDAGASGRWGKQDRSTYTTRTRELMLSSGLTLKPTSPLDLFLNYLRNESQGVGSTSLQESISGGALVRALRAERIFLTAQGTGGRQLASSVGPYDFLGGLVETGGLIYRMTRFRATSSAQRNTGAGGMVIPYQLTRQVQIETGPYSNLQVTATYLATYGGPTGSLLETSAENESGSLTTHPRGLGNWSISFNRNWTRGIGVERYVTVYGSTRNNRGLGLSLAYTRRDYPVQGDSEERRITDSLHLRAELEMRNRLTLGFTREETELGRPGGTVDWQATLRWVF